MKINKYCRCGTIKNKDMGYCLDCNKETQRKRKKYFSDYHKKRAQKHRNLLDRYKRFCGCKICGFRKYISSLVFHHLDPSQKESVVCALVYRSKDTMKKEMRKCIVLCSNCHTALHGEEITLENITGH